MFDEGFTRLYDKGVRTRSKVVQDTSKEMRLREAICDLVERSNVVCRLGKAVPAKMDDEALVSALTSSYVQSTVRETVNSVGVLLDTYSSFLESESKRVALEVIKEIAAEATAAALYKTIVTGEGKCDSASTLHQKKAERELSAMEGRTILRKK